MLRSRWTCWLVALLVGSSIAASGATARVSGSAGKAKANATTLNVNLAQAPVSLDPSTAYDITTLGFLQNFYVRLTQYGTVRGPSGTLEVDQGKIVPYLARSWSVSKDGKRYTFKLRPAKFNDGTPINAAAVKYSIERALKMGNTGAYVLTNGIPKLFKSIQAPSPDTVVLNLNQPNVDMVKDLATAWGSIVEPKLIEQNGGVKAGAVNKWMDTHIAGGGGPFVLQSYRPSIGAVMTRNPAFFGPPAKSATIRVTIVPSDVTLALQARSGRADVTIGLSPQSATSLKENPAVRVISNETDMIKRLGMLNTVPPFNNKVVRQALSYAIPYADILKKVVYGYGTLMFGPLAPAIPGFDTSLERPRAYDINKAKTMLARSGAKLPVTVQLAVANDISVDQQVATIIQSIWKPLGINVKILKLSPGAMVTAVVEHKYPLFIHGWSPFVYSPLYDFGLDAVCGAAYNSTNWCNRTADAAFKKAVRSSDPKQVRTLVNQIVRLFIEDVPNISLYVGKTITVLSKKVTSYTFQMQMDMRNWG